ncbi:hypothetical protein KIH07_02750 [Hydrogenophaga taeniospiralis]|jgi:hypothetical protein|uniref:hypothetical protein n=1 Tax=Hydrogenophaga taeniospiralis TaxID=65656 RepID=UPI0008B0BD29|nr:hypothetical protein [Hydrogenophaga taeniospiralis]MCB4362637.1 hypothetical protein [Hydrogenophaga taeniospiralis]OGB14673.1 MAG: hypothetical protein A3I64_09955 [Burkholderiales bacterium RIFCSPLOWO2_02_FULL_67_64]OGB43676.1 MAG: hypothetical protein A3E51_12615 [Burkholderiales bacterium RIFCSPHIGHO2_12_FULL_67_38]OGB44437.1 MAG: hypothetical protein A2W72_22605 [Burkholderiales bacterium RIFCSPLOWO2_12_67_14]
MSLSNVDTGQGGHFIPLSAWPSWTDAMHQASRAHRMGQVLQALAFYRLALGMAREGLAAGGALDADACVSALVRSSRCLSALQADEGSSALAAWVLADAHLALLGLIHREPGGSAWRKAAVWHSHETHAALLEHWQEHGADPAIEHALRAGCLVMSAPSGAVH